MLTPNSITNFLNKRKLNGNFRTLRNYSGYTDFASNDYLGFAKNKLIQRYALENDLNFDHLGSTGSRLISGNSELIDEVENQIANIHEAESALIFNSGYNANLALMSSVASKKDLILYDSLIHASIIDGIRLSYAKSYKFKHNDLNKLSNLLTRHKNKFENVYIVVESVYSMDGDFSPISEILELIKSIDNCYLIVDEAHALGVFDLGLVKNNDKILARVYTYGKAMGSHGAAIVGPNILKDYLVNAARPFIFSTALPRSSILSIKIAYEIIKNQTHRKLLNENINYFTQNISNKYNFIKSESAIQSLILGSNKLSDQLENLFLENKIFVKSIKSPSVAKGSERLRFCIHSFNTKGEIDKIAKLLSCYPLIIP